MIANGTPRRYNEIALTVQENVKTDLLLYRDRAYLLIPSTDAENEFLVMANKESIRYFISSTTSQDLSNLREFFRKLYPCEFINEEPAAIHDAQTLVLVNRGWNSRVREFHSESFLSLLVNFPKPLKESTLKFSVRIRSYTTKLSRKRKFSFIVSTSISGCETTFRDFEILVRQNLRRMKEESGWKMKVCAKKIIKFRTDLLFNPFCLNPFVSIVPDES
ncbi:MAG: hypothetical protein QW597_02110 [Thermoplasmataceae archaeon]